MVSRTPRLFVEGGGNHNDALKTECRRGFTALLEKAGFKDHMPRIVACGGRRNAFDQFCTAIDGGERTAVLLVDSEAPVTQKSPWQHVAERPGDEWVKPPDAKENQLHLMVQCMESWFLADRRALEEFFGQGFKAKALPAETATQEKVDKPDLYRKLQRATQSTKTKGAYDKGKHAFKLLATLDPALIRRASPWAERFFSTLEQLTR